MRSALCLAVVLVACHSEAQVAIDRAGQPTAVITVSQPTTISGLADQLRLNPDEADAWLTLRPRDAQTPRPVLSSDTRLTPVFVQTYRPAVPNTAVFHLGSATRWSTLGGFGPPREAFAVLMLLQAHSEAQAKRDIGYHVVFNTHATADDTRDALTGLTQNRTLAELSFFGHGDRGLINTTGDPDAGVIPQRYTTYGLPRLALHTCGSLYPAPVVTLAIDAKGEPLRLPPNTASHWQFNVAPAGRLIGYPQSEVGPAAVGLTVQLPGLRPDPRFHAPRASTPSPPG
ncbi:MAG: hypothetical protein AAGI68_07095 [Planctomycetota bacterium]